MNHCLLMMGGIGSRYGADRPKQYIEINGKPIFIYILQKLVEASCIDDIVVVSHSKWIGFVKEKITEYINTNKNIFVTKGGTTRSESVKNGLIAIRSIAMDEDVVLIHDATHPYVDIAGTEQIIEAVKKYGGATLGELQYDTCYRINDEMLIEEVVPRQYLISGASPEAFKFKTIYDIYMTAKEEELNAMTSAGAIALKYKIKMAVVPSNVLNLKITYKNDMDVFKNLVDNYFFGDVK